MSERQSTSKRELIAGLMVFVITFLIFAASHVRQIADSKYSMLVSESLLHHGTFTLDRFIFPDFGKLTAPGWGGIYQLEMIDGHVYYLFPPWFALLGVLAIKVRLSWCEQHEGKHYSARWKTEMAVGAVLLLVSVGINARGAINGATSLWNLKPVNVDDLPNEFGTGSIRSSWRPSEIERLNRTRRS